MPRVTAEGEGILVLLSGGVDSSTALAVAQEVHRGAPLYALSMKYGQRHALELQAASLVADHFGASWDMVEVPDVFGTDSLLMNVEPMPHVSYDEIAQSVGVSPTYVPYRNGTFLSLATAYALNHGCGFIYAGMHSEDARGWAYPDCTPEFLGAMANAIYVGTYHKVRLVAPFQFHTKADIVKLGHKLGVPFEHTWSCYEGKIPACGKCPTCVSRLEAFHQAGLEDPLKYEFDKHRRS